MATPPPTPTPTVFSNAISLVRAVMDLVMDFSFQKFVTPKLVRIIYAISLVAALLSGLTWMFSGFKDGITHGLFTLITGPVAFFVYVLFARVAMELVLAVFTIAEGIKKLEEKSR